MVYITKKMLLAPSAFLWPYTKIYLREGTGIEEKKQEPKGKY